jgi:hypothetical protein
VVLISLGNYGGRCRDRTCDPSRVKGMYTRQQLQYVSLTIMPITRQSHNLSAENRQPQNLLGLLAGVQMLVDRRALTRAPRARLDQRGGVQPGISTHPGSPCVAKDMEGHSLRNIGASGSCRAFQARVEAFRTSSDGTPSAYAFGGGTNSTAQSAVGPYRAVR